MSVLSDALTYLRAAARLEGPDVDAPTCAEAAALLAEFDRLRAIEVQHAADDLISRALYEVLGAEGDSDE